VGPPDDRKSEIGREDEVARLLAIQLRLQLGSQSACIAELSRAGFGPTRIATLLGTTANTVNVTLQKAKKSGRGKVE
jgi:hypothetical protein